MPQNRSMIPYMPSQLRLDALVSQSFVFLAPVVSMYVALIASQSNHILTPSGLSCHLPFESYTNTEICNFEDTLSAQKQ